MIVVKLKQTDNFLVKIDENLKTLHGFFVYICYERDENFYIKLMPKIDQNLGTAELIYYTNDEIRVIEYLKNWETELDIQQLSDA